MKKRYNTLKEESNRIKELFNDSKLYGNIINENLNDKKLITEQGGVKGKIIKAILHGDSINPEIPRARIIKAISSIQSTKLFNDFIDFEVKSISDMNRYLNDPEFAPIWKKIFTPIDGYSPDATFKGVQDYFGYLENDVDFKKLDEMNDADGTAFVIAEDLLPKEIGPIWLDFFYAKKLGYDVPSTTVTKNIEIRKVDNGRIEVKEKGPSGEDLNSKIYNNDGSIEGIETPPKKDGDTPTKKDGDEVTKKDGDTPTKTDGDTGGDGGTVRGEVDIDTNGNPDVQKGKIIAETLDLAEEGKFKMKKPMTWDEIETSIKENDNVLIVYDVDGNVKRYGKGQIDELTLELVTEADGNQYLKLISKETKTVDITDGGTGSGTGGGTGSGTGGGTGSGNKPKIPWTQKGQNFLRWAFPQTSTAFKWVIVKPWKGLWKDNTIMRNWYGDKPPNIFNLGKKSDAPIGSLDNPQQNPQSSFIQRASNFGLRIGVEYAFIGAAYGVVEEYIATGGKTPSGKILTYYERFFASEFFKYQPLLFAPNMVYKGLDYLFVDSDVWDVFRTACESACIEQGEDVAGIQNTSCYKECKKKIDDLEKEYNSEALKAKIKNMDSYLKTLKEMEDGNWSQEKSEDFCNCEEKMSPNRCQIQEDLLKIKDVYGRLETKLDAWESSNGVWWRGVKEYIRGIDWVPDTFKPDAKLSETLLSRVNDKGEIVKFDGASIDKDIKRMDKYCTNVKNTDIGTGVPELEDNSGGSEDNSGGSEDNSGGPDFVKVKIELTPITITDIS